MADKFTAIVTWENEGEHVWRARIGDTSILLTQFGGLFGFHAPNLFEAGVAVPDRIVDLHEAAEYAFNECHNKQSMRCQAFGDALRKSLEGASQ